MCSHSDPAEAQRREGFAQGHTGQTQQLSQDLTGACLTRHQNRQHVPNSGSCLGSESLHFEPKSQSAGHLYPAASYVLQIEVILFNTTPANICIVICPPSRSPIPSASLLERTLNFLPFPVAVPGRATQDQSPLLSRTPSVMSTCSVGFPAGHTQHSLISGSTRMPKRWAHLLL